MAEVDLASILRLVAPTIAQRNAILRKQRLRFDWLAQARPEQIAPGEPGAAISRKDWRNWLVQTGRGWGKTRSGAEEVRKRVREGRWRSIALVAPTLGDGRKLMIEGPTGIIECSPEAERPRFIEKDREVVWPNGAKGYLYSSEEPERLRGGNHDGAWLDEVGSWRNDMMTWRMLRLAVRITGPLGDRPQIIITTTPRPTPLLRWVLAQKGTQVQHGSTYDNQLNLDQDFFDAIKEEFEGTRLGEQEIDGKLLGDTPGALWRMSTIDNTRVLHVPSDLARVVVAIDPAVADPEEKRLARLDSEHTIAETGIVIAGRARCLCNGKDEHHAFILRDVSGFYSPEDWAITAIGAYDEWSADRMVGEQNNGGALVAANVRAQAAGRRISYSGVHASRGKQTRAEPIATLYERGVVHHVGVHPKLEDQMCLIAGTRITTARGAVPIEQVKTGDLALTRAGWRPVTWAGLTGYAPTLSLRTAAGHELRGTTSHPIWVESRGWVPLGSVGTGDRVRVCTSATRLSSSRDADIRATSATGTGRAAAPAGGFFCTVGCGNPCTDPSHLATTCITETRTAATTPSRIWRPSAASTTRDDTRPLAASSTRQRFEARAESQSGRPKNREHWLAVGADKASRPPGSEPCAVAGPATADGIALVFNLSVEGLPEYFANGVLTHNCTWSPLTSRKSPDRMDAMVWALTELMLTPGANIHGRPAHPAMSVPGRR